MKIPPYSPKEEAEFRANLKWHEGYLLRKLAPFERENEEMRQAGRSFKERAPVREKIAEIDKNLANVRLLINKRP